jgi:DNA-binding response OmpR family regulator
LLSPEMREVALTTAEFNCLNVLASHAGRVLSRERLLDLVYGREWNPLDRAIDTLVSRLRKKLEQASRPTDLIKNVRGIGYVFTARTGH